MQRVAVALASIAVAGTVACSDPCSNRVIESLTDPSGSKNAILYTRSCGATTGPSTNISILDRGVAIPSGAGNALVVKDPVSVAESLGVTRLRWLNPDTLQVSILAGRSIQRKQKAVGGVAIQITRHAGGSRSGN